MKSIWITILRFFHHNKQVRQSRCYECHKQGDLYYYVVELQTISRMRFISTTRRMLLHSSCAKLLWKQGASVNLCQ